MPKLLDLFCGAGGCSVGYHRAGFEVVGVDIEPMPHYPFEFHQSDALEYLQKHGHEFDAIHASPPCQGFSAMQHIRKNSAAHADLVEPVRLLLLQTEKPYVIENVRGAPLVGATMLCGSFFGLKIIRHRYFECPWMPLVMMPPCNHNGVFDPWHGQDRTAGKFRAAMDIDWMPIGGGRSSGKARPGNINQAIPPAYTEWIGKQLMEVLNA